LGSSAIRKEIEALKKQGKKVPAYWLDSTTNNADCVAQGLNPSAVGHAFDSYKTRTSNMASLFAALIDTAGACFSNVNSIKNQSVYLSVQPNPFQNTLQISLHDATPKAIQLMDITGRDMPIQIENNGPTDYRITCSENIPSGMYFILITRSNGATICQKVVR
jgi:hypothetical protein